MMLDVDEIVNKLNDEQCKDLRVPDIAMGTFMIVLMIVGIFGNAIVFFVIIVLKEYKKSVSNWYILQLSLADTLFLLMLPFDASEEMTGTWDFPISLCKAKEGILMVNYYASVIFLTIMSFDRFMAVTMSGVSKWADVLRRLDSAALISLIAWLVSISLAIPLYLYSHVTKCTQCSYSFPVTAQERCLQATYNATECDPWLEQENNLDPSEGTEYVSPEDLARLAGIWLNITENGKPVLSDSLTDSEKGICRRAAPTSYRTWLYLNFSIMLVLPFVLISIFYGMILRAMMGTKTSCTNQRQYRRRVTLMVLALVTLFLISWLPWYVVKLAQIGGFPMSSYGCQRLTNFVVVLSYLNSALNPYFYSFMGSRFHQRFLRARSTATRKSRFLTVLARISFHGQDSNHSTSGGGATCRTNLTGKERNLSRVKSQSDDESFGTKSNLRTERTVVEPTTMV